MEKHRPSFKEFILLSDKRKLTCKHCGVELQLSKKQKRIHLIIIPSAWTIIAIFLISFGFPWYEPIRNLTNKPIVNRLIIALFFVIMYFIIMVFEYFFIRFEPSLLHSDQNEKTDNTNDTPIS